MIGKELICLIFSDSCKALCLAHAVANSRRKFDEGRDAKDQYGL
jgi:hypothetical protein